MHAAPQGLNPDAFEPVKVIKKYNVSHDTVFVRFAYANEDAVSGLTIASCLLLSAPIGEVREDGTRETVIRPYTPVSAPDTKCALCHPENAPYLDCNCACTNLTCLVPMLEVEHNLMFCAAFHQTSCAAALGNGGRWGLWCFSVCFSPTAWVPGGGEIETVGRDFPGQKAIRNT